jgi:hypothetical protein
MRGLDRYELCALRDLDRPEVFVKKDHLLPALARLYKRGVILIITDPDDPHLERGPAYRLAVACHDAATRRVAT